MDRLANDRKLDHIRVIQADQEVDRQRAWFDRIHLRHRALPQLDLGAIDTTVEILDKRLSFPLLISSMTGGDHDLLRKINRNLAHAAEKTGVAMGVGSQRVMFAHPEARASFALRQYAPNALLFANLGAVQLNYGFGLSHCQEAVDVVGADALYLHLNPLQEAVQPEGDTNFSGLAEKIGDIAGELSCPVVLKEVGAGISPADVELVLDHGVHHIDVAGTGGTSWSRIEHYRSIEQGGPDLGLTFQDWGIPTPLALQLLAPYSDRLELVASGGIRNGIDMAKAIILGARLCGMASPFLKPAMDSTEAVIARIKQLRQEFTTAMFLLGTGSIDDLHHNPSLIVAES